MNQMEQVTDDADCRPYYTHTHTHTGKWTFLAAEMLNLQPQSDTERFICRLFANWTHTHSHTHKSGPPQHTLQPLNINYPPLSCGWKWWVCVYKHLYVSVCVLQGGGKCTRRNSQPNNFELSPWNNPLDAATLAPVPKTAAYGCHRPKQDVVSRQENYTITRPT